MKAEKPSEFAMLPSGASLEQVSITIMQEEDSCSPKESGNILYVSTPNAGGGNYIVIEGRWAMDNEKEINELAAMLIDLMRRACK